jgi:hypothetical protein
MTMRSMTLVSEKSTPKLCYAKPAVDSDCKPPSKHTRSYSSHVKLGFLPSERNAYQFYFEAAEGHFQLVAKFVLIRE